MTYVLHGNLLQIYCIIMFCIEIPIVIPNIESHVTRNEKALVGHSIVII